MAGPNPGSLRIDTSNEPPVPPITAAFLVNFDHRKGYTIGWHRSLDNIKIEGVVEYKSLPSGLHNVEEDLVYFIHDEYAGLSAFVNRPDEQSERAASMLAVGILVPLEHGRMGRSWRHAESLKKLARAQSEHPKDTTALEEYWEKYKLRPDNQPLHTPSDSVEQINTQRSNGYMKSRSMSTATTFISSHHALTPHHPALALLDSIKIFGPLIFPLYRAALLRKRILIVTDTPVELSCQLVYNLSILSSISKSLFSLLPGADTTFLRTRPLFVVGVMDIPELERTRPTSAAGSPVIHPWIACTTDDVLSTKPDLYDILVLMPRRDSQNATTKVFPRIVVSNPELVRAFPKAGIKSTRRDYHRFVHLQQGLRHYAPSRTDDTEAGGDDDASSIMTESSSYSENKAVVESPSWSRVAYTSLVWWASAGDRRGGLAEFDEDEADQDSALLHTEEDEARTREVALVAYFHRMTATIFQTIAAAIVRTDGNGAEEDRYRDDDDREDTDPDENPTEQSAPVEEEESQALLAHESQQSEVEISQEDMTIMGLDTWSASDKKFVEDLVELWFRRKAVVRSASIECCGLRIL